MDARLWPIREKCLQRCHLLTSNQEGPHQKLFCKKKKLQKSEDKGRARLDDKARLVMGTIFLVICPM